MCYMPLHTTSLQFPQLFEDFAVKMFKAIKCKNVLASQDRWKIWGWLGFVPTTQCQIGPLFFPLPYFHSFRDWGGVK